MLVLYTEDDLISSLHGSLYYEESSNSFVIHEFSHSGRSEFKLHS
jgi:hypothetical protein